MRVLLWDVKADRLASMLRERPLPAGAEIIAANSQEEAMAQAAGAEVLVTWDTDKAGPFLKQAVNLRLIQTLGVGVERLMANGAAESPVPLANARGSNAAPIAEHVMALILAFARSIHIAVRNQMRHEWRPKDCRNAEIATQTLGILGLGCIGRETARRAKAMGMRVISLERPGRAKPPEVDELVPDRLALCAAADYLLVALPLTAETRQIIGEAELSAMKPTACLINISRGRAVDEEALIGAIRDGRIAGAGLDVTVEEPLPANSPLWELPGVIITPHVAASSPRTLNTMMDMIAENLRRLAAGQPVLNLVDKQKGY